MTIKTKKDAIFAIEDIIYQKYGSISQFAKQSGVSISAIKRVLFVENVGRERFMRVLSALVDDFELKKKIAYAFDNCEKN